MAHTWKNQNHLKFYPLRVSDIDEHYIIAASFVIFVLICVIFEVMKIVLSESFVYIYLV